jgi:hypothetical protein
MGKGVRAERAWRGTFLFTEKVLKTFDPIQPTFLDF